jgi:hypothetical protein
MGGAANAVSGCELEARKEVRIVLDSAVDKRALQGISTNLPWRDDSMSPTLERKIRFSTVVFAIQTTPKSFRKWLQCPELIRGLSDGPDDGSWRDFSYAEVASFALMRPLVSFGLTVGEASDFAQGALMERARPLLKFKTTPPEAFAALFEGFELLIWHGESELLSLVVPIGDNRPADAFLSIDIGETLKAAFDRIEEMVTGED